jgi:hypothetical protein
MTAMQKSMITLCIAGALGLASLGPAPGEPLCRPKLTVTDVRFSKFELPSLERKWTAKVLVDDTRCAANSSGYFDLGVSRLKENAMEDEFREKFIWMAPSTVVGVDFWADEAVETYWIDGITPCVCAQAPPPNISATLQSRSRSEALGNPTGDLGRRLIGNREY